MCCIFTCCGWMVDLVQRVWVFAMSCCISSAVCCVLITSSMSGVALGYNYSLAEYIDSKETNVSVYIKRGVFDDDLSDVGEFRRSGQPSLKGLVRDDGNLKTAAPDEAELMPKSGRRLDDTILESDDHNKFEGNLMRLTVKPPHPSTTTTGVTSDEELFRAVSPFKEGSLDQLKGIQSVINARKATARRDPAAREPEQSTFGYDAQLLAHFPDFPRSPEQARRMMSSGLMEGPGLDPPEVEEMKQRRLQKPPGPKINPARYAVPSVQTQDLWMRPKLPPKVYKNMFTTDVDGFEEPQPTFPKPVTYRTGPVRPTATSSEATPPPIQPKLVTRQKPKPSIGQDMEDFNKKLFGIQRTSTRVPTKDKGSGIKTEESSDYYEDLKGLPVRKKRSINQVAAKLHQSKIAAQAIPQKTNQDLLSKFKVGMSISNEITDRPSISLSKLHFPNKVVSNETVPTNGKETNSTKAVGVVNDSIKIVEVSKDKVLRIIRSMFS